MKKSVLICGQAGQGINFTSSLLGRTLRNAGCYVFVYRDYGSLIRGGHNFNVVIYSDQPVHSHQNKFDAVIDLDGSLSRHRSSLKRKALIFNEASLAKFSGAEKSKSGDFNRVNNALLGMLVKSLGLPFDGLRRAAKREINSWAEAVRVMRRGYDFASVVDKNKILPGKKRYFLSGTNGAAMGALASGLDVYLSYPMTPATGLMIELARQAEQNGVLVSQLEDEVGIVNTALGASYGGAITMVGSSGGGFALMTEALSLSGMAEIPLVVYLAQRTGPSTGVPTYTSQGDLNFARFAGHGEFPRVLVAPGDPQETVSRTMEAFYLAYRYRLPVVLLTDKHLAESYYTLDKIEYPRINPDRFIVDKPGRDYRSYALTSSGVSLRAVPGQNAWVRASSYEHDQYGFTVEDEETIKKMNDKRLKKMKIVSQKIDGWQPAKVWGKGPNLIVGWGSTQGVIRDSLPELSGYRFLQISYISPFPKKFVEKEIAKSKKVVLVENNATGLLGQLIAMETGQLTKNKVLKYDGRPFTADDIVAEVKKIK